MPEYKWPPVNQRRVIGKPVNRVDGLAKASGKAVYSTDIKRPGMLFAALLTCPHAHARVTSIDTSEAERSPGVKAVRVIARPGTEIQYAGAEVAMVAAETEEQARDAVRKIKVQYEVLPHLVKEFDLQRAQAMNRAKPSGEVVTGDPDQALKEADVVHEGEYTIPVITHSCLQPHGQVVEWKDDQIEFFANTQAVSTVGDDLAKQLEVPAKSIHVWQHSVGGAFGSKFQAELWGAEAARLSKAAGGRPVWFHLDRRPELEIAGCRPSFHARIKIGAKKDGTITVWDWQSWSTGGVTGGGVSAALIPYVFSKVPNKRVNHTAVSINAGGARAWRAPNHPQLSFLTCAAMEDLAARLGMDPLELFLKNVQQTDRPETYAYQLKKAAELSEWSKKWHPRGKAESGPVKTGLGIGVGTWGGLGHNSECRARIHPDGTVEVELGSQDLGTGTRTVIRQVAAESLGLTVKDIRLNIGDNRYPQSGASGGSTTVGGVAASTRRATLNALEELFKRVAPDLGVPPDQLEAVEGTIRVKGNPSKSLSWKEACRRIGSTPIEATGTNNQRNPGGLIDGGVGGVQIAEVQVDTETGLVRLKKLVIVQDCGLIINPKTAESQCYGAATMSICAALMEERIMDQVTGRFLNADYDFYQLARIMDIGEIVVHLDDRPENDARGVIGLGEPPVVPTIAAISNAVANAIGVRVPEVPLTPDRVLAALARRKA